MEIKVLEESKNRIVFEVAGEDATFCNILRKELWNDDSVKIASYAIEHPNIGIPKMIVETTGKPPRDVLVDAAKRLKKEFAKFKTSFEKEVK